MKKFQKIYFHVNNYFWCGQFNGSGVPQLYLFIYLLLGSRTKETKEHP
jgi:hypothetical protein